MSELKLELPSSLRGRLPVLDELKGLAIILVILYHAGGVLVWPNYLHGDLGVDIFIILSGLGLALNPRSESAGTFLRRRLLRIMPTYWIVLTAYWVCNTHYLQHHYSATNLVVHYLGIHGWFGDLYAMGINDSFWFITLIITLYLLYCVVRRLGDDLGRILLFGGVFSCAFAFALFFTGQGGSFGHLGLRVPGFFLGLLIGQLLRDGRLSLPLGWPLYAAALLFGYAAYVPGIIFFTPLAALAIMGAYLFLWRPYAPSIARRVISCVFKFCGDHSLELFLLHQPLIRNYNYYLHGRWMNIPAPTAPSLAVGILIGLAVTFPVAIALRFLLKKILPEKKSAA